MHTAPSPQLLSGPPLFLQQALYHMHAYIPDEDVKGGTSSEVQVLQPRKPTLPEPPTHGGYLSRRYVCAHHFILSRPLE